MASLDNGFLFGVAQLGFLTVSHFKPSNGYGLVKGSRARRNLMFRRWQRKNEQAPENRTGSLSLCWCLLFSMFSFTYCFGWYLRDETHMSLVHSGSTALAGFRFAAIPEYSTNHETFAESQSVRLFLVPYAASAWLLLFLCCDYANLLGCFLWFFLHVRYRTFLINVCLLVSVRNVSSILFYVTLTVISSPLM